MARLNYRLSEWLKRVDKSEAEYINRKTKNTQAETEKEKADVNHAADSVSDDAYTSNVRVVKNPDGSAVPETPKITPVIEEKTSDPMPFDQEDKSAEPKLKLTPEGTGVPRPIASVQQSTPEPQTKTAEQIVKPVKDSVRIKPSSPVASEPKSSVNTERLQENWSRLPHHLQILFGTDGADVAQRSYKSFKDTREELIERLLDPPLTLEDTARILNVCPTTVRRYTNRNLLKHYRTPGNQRRFKLSDVLAFMETYRKHGSNTTDTRKLRKEE